MKIVSFTGPKGSGKDTAAALLAEAGISQGKISFAGPMKEILSRVLGIPLATFEDPVLKERPFHSPIDITKGIFREILREMLLTLPYTEFDYPRIMWNETILVLKSPRHALQVIGTEFIRKQIGADWHVAAAFREDALAKLDPNGLYCVTDARFPNEYEWLKKRFGNDFVGFYVERPEAEKLLESATHESELQVKEVRKLIPLNRVLSNAGSIEFLRNQVIFNLKENQ